MITYFEADLNILSVHHIGNSSQNEMYSLSDDPIQFKDEIIPGLLMRYFLSPFEKANEVYHLMHGSGGLQLNEVYTFASEIFTNKNRFQEVSQQIAKYLY